ASRHPILPPQTCDSARAMRSWRPPAIGRKERGGPKPSGSRSSLAAASAAFALAHLSQLPSGLTVADEQEHARRDREDGCHEEAERSRRGRLPGELVERARRDLDHNEALPARRARGDDDQSRFRRRPEDAL